MDYADSSREKISGGVRMYLSMLSRNQKELFLELAYQLAFADKDYSENEKNMMKAYCQEMQLPEKVEEFSKGLNEIIDDLNAECSETEKKIVLFEIVGFALVDGNYDENEKCLIRSVQKKFEIEPEYINNCEKILEEYISFQTKINTLVLG